MFHLKVFALNESKNYILILHFHFRQNDIGLEKYVDTKNLFLHLFYPTFLVVITVVQLQMFHKKYLEHLELPTIARRDNSDSGIQPTSSVNYGSLEPDLSTENEHKTKSHHFKVPDLKELSAKKVCFALE